MGLFTRDEAFEPVKPANFDTFRPITAAAARIKISDKSEAAIFKARQNSSTRQWQSEAWEYYDAITEIKYALSLVASVVSRIKLYAAAVSSPSEAPTSVDNSASISPELASAAKLVLQRLDSAYGGQAGLLRDAALNLAVAGECYLVQMPARPSLGLDESWDIRSVDEFMVDTQGNYVVVPRRPSGTQSGSASTPGAVQLPPGTFAGRIWRAHPRYSEEPDSSLRGLLDLCDELLLLNKVFRSTERSRMNAGAIYLPDGLSASASPDVTMTDEAGNLIDMTAEEVEDEFEDNFIDALSTPIEDESSASAVVPLIIRGPADLADKIKVIKFERTWDDTHIARADRVLERILQGLDVPKDIVTGLANVKYSNAVQIDESLYKAHIEPLLLLISDSITMVYLRPSLLRMGFTEEEVNKIVVWYDPSAVATRNDRAQDADSGFEKMAISWATWRSAHGFSQDDAPSDTEMVMRMLLEKGSISDELSQQLLSTIAPDIMGKAREVQQQGSVAPIPANVEQALRGETPTDPAATPDGAESPADGPTEPDMPTQEPAPATETPAPPLAEPENPPTAPRN